MDMRANPAFPLEDRWEPMVEKTIEGLIEEARRLPLAQRLMLIERLARSLQTDLEMGQALREELTTWDGLSDEALENFESRL